VEDIGSIYNTEEGRGSGFGENPMHVNALDLVKQQREELQVKNEELEAMRAANEGLRRELQQERRVGPSGEQQGGGSPAEVEDFHL
jgi:hypothetical protein